MKVAVLILRSLLGVIYVVFGLNFFFHFITMQQPGGAAGAFEGGLFGAGYFFPFMKVIEITSGILLLANKYTALVLLVIFPVTLNIFLFHAFLAQQGLALGGPMLLINVFLAYAYRKYYAGLFTPTPVL